MGKSLTLLLPLVALAACSEANQSAGPEVADEAAAPAADVSASKSGAIEVVLPQIAYSYSYRFRLDGDAIPALQARHVAMCDELGLAKCRVVDMKRSAGEGDYATGSLKLAVASPLARAFGAKLGQTAEDVGGAIADSAITAEDLSKRIVDTEARLRQRQLLAERLTEVLATRRGTVAELVEAERAVAQVQEEIDQARSWLAEMRGRVAMSGVDIAYESGSPGGGGFAAPIRDALGSAGRMLGISIAGLITVAVALGPWIALLLLGLWGWRRWRRRTELPPEDGLPPT